LGVKQAKGLNTTFRKVSQGYEQQKVKTCLDKSRFAGLLEGMGLQWVSNGSPMGYLLPPQGTLRCIPLFLEEKIFLPLHSHI
jgi:hypothetical protein